MKKRYTVCTFTDGVTKVLEEAREQCLARLKRLREKELEVDLDD